MNLKSIGFCGFAFNAPQLDGKEWGRKKENKYSMTTDDEADVTQQIWILVPFTPMQFGTKSIILPT